jgi:hypothetical protein
MRQVAAYTDLPANHQLVPYHQDKSQLVPYSAESSRMRSLSGGSTSERYTLFPPLFEFGYNRKPDRPESAYNSSRLLITPKMYQVGLLIDIYA